MRALCRVQTCNGKPPRAADSPCSTAAAAAAAAAAHSWLAAARSWLAVAVFSCLPRVFRGKRWLRQFSRRPAGAVAPGRRLGCKRAGLQTAPPVWAALRVRRVRPRKGRPAATGIRRCARCASVCSCDLSQVGPQKVAWPVTGRRVRRQRSAVVGPTRGKRATRASVGVPCGADASGGGVGQLRARACVDRPPGRTTRSLSSLPRFQNTAIESKWSAKLKWLGDI